MLKARDALSMFGVCSSASGDPAQMARQMNAIGFTLLRCACETPAHLAFLLAVQKLVPGFRFNWLITAYNNNVVTDQQQFDLIKQAETQGLNVWAVEPDNEINNPDTGSGSHLPGSTTPLNNNDNPAIKAAILAWVKDVFDHIAANYPKVLRLGGTALAYDADTVNAVQPNDEVYINMASLHCYPPPGQQPCSFDGAGDVYPGIGDVLHMGLWNLYAQTGGKNDIPVALTETGQPGGPVIQPNRVMDYTVQAKIMGNLACDALAQKLGLCIFYCLADPGADPGNNGGPEPHFGFFNNDGSAKIVAATTKRLFDLFRDGGSDFAPKPLLVTVAGLGMSAGASGPVAVVARDDGKYVVPVWNEPKISDGTHNITPATVSAVVGWGSNFDYSVIDLMSGQQVLFGTGTGVTIPLNGYPMCVVLIPKGSATAPVGSVPVATPVQVPAAPIIVAGPGGVLTLDVLQALPAGLYTLTPSVMQPLSVGLSEDAYLGDCSVNIALDGKMLLTSLPVVQLKASNGLQSVPLGTVDGTKPHTVVITFLNDQYAGTPQTDRNLYVNSYTLGSKTVAVNGQQLGGGDYTLAIPIGG